MGPMAFFAATALLGFQFGWQPRPEGGVQYIIELTPEALEAMRAGESIESDLPPQVLQEVRSFRIVVGDKILARKLPPRPAAAPAALPLDLAGKALAEQPAAFVAPASAGNPAATAIPARPAANAAAAPAAGPAVAGEPAAERPWLPLWLTVLALFASLGGNLFLAWITWDARSRYRSLLGQAVA